MAESSNRIFAVALVLVTLVAVGIFFQADVEDQLSPELVRAWVAIEVDESGVAEVGPVTLDETTPFRLRAVVEAEGRGGRPVYYTEAKRLRIHGEDVPAEQVQTWQRSRPVKVRWFTVEGKRPFVKIAEGALLDDTFEIVELARSDWPLAWTIAGEIDAAHDNHLAALSVVPRQLFGIQRYHVRVEIYTLEDDLLPREIIRSWGAEKLLTESERFPSVERALPGTLAAPSRVFGLTQLHLPAQPGDLQTQVDAMARRKLVFTRPTVIRDLLADVGRGFDSLTWEPLDLDGSARWAESAAEAPGPRPGDLVRVGDRLVVLYEDRGEPGVFDYGDWCLDYVQGASVRALGDVFSGEGLTVEWAPIAP